MTDVYRSAASVVLLRPVGVCTPDGCGDAYQLLLLHKPRKKDAWQLPQGGVEAGETIEQAALRELNEEASVQNPRVLGRSKDVYCYDFPPSFRRFRPDNVCGQRIEFVFALGAPDTKVTVDNNEIDAHAWVDESQLGLYLKRQEYLDLVLAMMKEAVSLAGTRQ